MPRLIWVFAWRTVILWVLSRGGSYVDWHTVCQLTYIPLLYQTDDQLSYQTDKILFVYWTQFLRLHNCFFFFFLNELFIIHCTVQFQFESVGLRSLYWWRADQYYLKRNPKNSVNYENMRINFFKQKIASSVCVSNELQILPAYQTSKSVSIAWDRYPISPWVG